MASDEETSEQQHVERQSRETGGDAEAAASVEEREAVAKDEDEEFSGGDE